MTVFNVYMTENKEKLVCPSMLVSKKHPLCVEDLQLGHKVEVDEGQRDQQVLHQIEDGRNKAEEGNEANAHKEEG